MSQYDPKLVRFYIDIYICTSFGGNILDSIYAKKLKFDMLFTQTKTFNSVLEFPMAHVLI